MVKDHRDSQRGNLLQPLHGYSFQLEAKDFLYAPSHRQDSTCYSLCYTTCRALAGTRDSFQRWTLISNALHINCGLLLKIYIYIYI